MCVCLCFILFFVLIGKKNLLQYADVVALQSNKLKIDVHGLIIYAHSTKSIGFPFNQCPGKKLQKYIFSMHKINSFLILISYNCYHNRMF